MRKKLWMTLSGVVALPIAGIVYLAWPDPARLDVADVSGTKPVISEPRPQVLPTVKIADAKGWAPGEAPLPAKGLAVTRFAAGLEHPRWLYQLPNGDILVAETNSPPRTGGGIAEWVMEKLLDRAGALVPSPNRITLLRDADHDGRAEFRRTFLEGSNSPFGMALVGSDLYIADTDRLLRFDYKAGQVKLNGVPDTVATYPSEGHWARNVVASADGKKLYVSVGSGSNAGEAGMAQERGRAAILEIDRATHQKRVFGAGMRNPNGMAFEPQTGKLWTVVNERDMLGSDLVPDYLTSVSDGDHFGWPWYYWGRHRDASVEPGNPKLAARVRQPDYALGPHVAALGLTFAKDVQLGPEWRNGAFIGLHGSWNRKPLSGYKVVYVPFGEDGQPAAGRAMQTVLSGFLSPDNKARGRPVGVIGDGAGSLLVADDVGNIIWRVTAKTAL